MTRIAPCLGFALLAWACGGDGGTTTSRPTVSRVDVSVPATPLVVGTSALLTATARDAAGAVITGRTVTWSASPASVATVDQAGTLTGLAAGTSVVTAAVDGVVGTASVTIVPASVTTVSITPSPMLVAVGGTATTTAVARDQTGAAVAQQSFTFRSSDETIATVSAAGVVTGLRAGTVSITAATQGATAVSGAASAIVVAPVRLAGRVLTADGGPPGGLVFSARTGAGTGAQSFSTTLDASGAFTLSAPLGSLPSDSLDLVLDIPSGSRTYRPIDVRTTVARAPVLAARPLLIPRTMSFTSTTYGTTSLTVSLQLAFTRVCSDDTNANCNSFFPQIWKNAVPLWAEADLPIPLAFNYTATTSPLGASDSIALWGVIRQMEADIGRPLFKPATFKDLTPPDANGYSQKAVLVWVDNTLSGSAGYTNWIWDGSQNMLAAKTRVTNASLLGNRPLMTHELLHALGFHHTCAWPTVMGGYGCSSQPGATKADVAAFDLGYAARRTIIASLPTTTFGDALRGEQAFDVVAVAALGRRAPVPFTPKAFRAMLFGGRPATSDGAP